MWSETITIGDLLLRSAERRPRHEALVLPGTRRTYGELAADARQVAAGLLGLGVEPGDHVGILMPNGPEFVAALFGAAIAGAVAVPVNARFRGPELAYVVGHSDVRVLIVSDLVDEHVDFVERLQESFPELAAQTNPLALRLEGAAALRSIVMLGDRTDAHLVTRAQVGALAAQVSVDAVERRRAAVRNAQIGVILYTSGTTAHPKGCMLTHESLVRDWRSVTERLAITADDRVWAPCPMFHLAAIGPMLFAFDCGATLLTAPHFEPRAALSLIAAERATVLYPAYPPITQGVLTLPEFPAADLSAARAILNVAPPDTLRAMQAALPRAVQVSLYGLTEGSGAVTYNELDDDLETRVGTCGTPLPGTEVAVIDPATGLTQGPGEPGEILVRGVGVANGYYKDPVKTAETIDPDRWLHTGDLGRLDADGRLLFLGRLKEMLKVGGENVAPAEIEALLSTHPAISLVQVVGIPDARLDEVAAAFVELRPGAVAGEDELLEFCTGKIASFKIPRLVRFVDEWPMSATKIQKERLRERLLDELGLSARA